jgi:hypothetical protein
VSPIIDIQRRLVEVGRIRMGKRAENGAPTKLETFRITSRDQSRLTEIAGVYGGDVVPWAEREGEFEVITATDELPILLLPGQALSQWYELWSAGGCQRRCDGENDVISDGPCVCSTERGDRNCKPTTRLSVMLPEIPGLGVWRLESHGYYAAVELSATAGMLEQATAQGQVFPARLRIDQRAQVKEGKTTRYAVPVIDIDVRLPEALGFSAAPEALPSRYRPIAELEQSTGVSVTEGLEAAARQAEPKAQTARSAEPIGAAGDFMDSSYVPVPADDVIANPEKEEAGAATPIPPNVPPAPTKAQLGKLGALVGKLRDDQGAITTDHLWAAVAAARSYDKEQMVELFGGLDDDGVLHWGPLLETLTRPEASELIDRLSALEEKAAA